MADPLLGGQDASDRARAASFIDSHVHVVCADTARFPRQPTGVGSSWWSSPEGDSEAVFASARSAGASHVVVVQAVGAYGFDSACAAAAAASSGGFANLVTAADMNPVGRSVTDGLDVCAGWRLFGVADGAPWLDDDRAEAVWARAAELGVVLVPTIFTDRLDALRRIVERHPDVNVALDHCAFPDMAGEAGERALFAIADLAPIRLKVTTHVLAAWRAEGRLDDVFARLVDTFGPHRLCWGSDHPQHQGLTYQGKLDLARHAARHLDQDQRDQFFTGTASSLGWGSSSV